jgi:hypothetical protein
MQQRTEIGKIPINAFREGDIDTTGGTRISWYQCETPGGIPRLRRLVQRTGRSRSAPRTQVVKLQNILRRREDTHAL